MKSLVMMNNLAIRNIIQTLYMHIANSLFNSDILTCDANEHNHHMLYIYVRVVLLDFSKAFDPINHHILLEKLTNSGLPGHIVRWIGAFLLDRSQKVMIGSNCSGSGSPYGGVPQGTLSGPKCFLIVR